MSDMIIQIIAVEQGTAKSKAGKDYQFLEVAYKNKSFQDKVESKKHNQFGDKTVFNTLKDAQTGEVYTINRVKEGEYWQWIGITSGTVSSGDSAGNQSSNGSAKSAGNPVPKSNYETAEERAKRQVYIIRQSSISSAIETLKTDKKSPSVQEVLEVAKKYEQFVFGIDDDAQPANALPKMDGDDLEDDIPY